jgi:starvation-inducible DNA-binding protein
MAAKDAVSKTTGNQRSTAPQQIPVEIGLDQKSNQGVADLFCQALADEVTFYTKLRKYHWNVTGPDFFSLHEAFEKQYKETEENIDEIAEYVRTYGAFAPGTLDEFKRMTTLEEAPGIVPSANAMVADVVGDHEAIIRGLRTMVEKAENEYEDAAAADILTGYIEEHQKAAWMMRAFLQGLDSDEQ